jgi:hypothetical protein
MDEDILAMLLTTMVVFVPVAGLTMRFALKPIVDSIARLMEARAQTATSELLEKRLALVEQELQAMRAEVARVVERGDFYDKLAVERLADHVPARSINDGGRSLVTR